MSAAERSLGNLGTVSGKGMTSNRFSGGGGG